MAEPAGLQEMAAQALARPASAPAIEYEGRWYDWGQMRHVACQIWALLEASGADQRAAVTFVPRNRPSAVAALFALLAQGRTIRMVYAFQSPAGIARDATRLNAPVIIAAAQDFTPELEAALHAGGMAGIALDEMDAHPLAGCGRTAPERREDGPGEARLEILTSGTTGPPKQFPIRYEMIAKSYLGGASVDAAAPAAAPPGILYFPLGNITGIYATVPPLVKGQRMILLDRFSLEKWHDYVVRYRPATSGIPPTAMRALLDADIPGEDLASIKSMGSGAAPLDPALHRAFETRYGIPVLLSYGATEFGGPVTAMTLDLYPRWGKEKFGSVGRPIGGAQLRVIDPDTEQVLPPNRPGLLEIVSPRIGTHWIRTSDVARIDEDGFLFHLGRADGAIMRGGFKILPETIERALLLHPAVAAAGVVGVADERVAQVPGAAIELRAGCEAPSIDALARHLRQHVLATHVPAHWRFVAALPKTPSFKIDRPALARLFTTEAASGDQNEASNV